MPRLSSRPRRRHRLIIAGVLLVAPLLYVGALGYGLSSWGMIERAQPSDAILIFGTGVREDGTASSTLRARARHGYELWKLGLAPLIVCTGGVGAHPPAESLVQEKLLIEWGVPASVILREERSTSTWENAMYAAPLLPKGASVIAVSDPFHLWRCQRDCEAFGLKATTSPALSNWNVAPRSARASLCAREAVLVTRDLVLGALHL